MLILFHTWHDREGVHSRVEDVQPRLGRDETSYRASLRQFALLREEGGEERVEFMVAMGLRYGWLLRPDPAREIPSTTTPRRRLRPGARAKMMGSKG
jgi:hypothetical protein